MNPASELSESKTKEQLARMSFGDHLDELRRRMLWCAGTLFLCVTVMFPFKDRVTEIYTTPYDFMWNHSYRDFVRDLEVKFKAQKGPADPQARLAAADFLTKELTAEVLAGDYTDAAALRRQSGFELAMPAKSSPEWNAFSLEFSRYAAEVRSHKLGTRRYIWHQENSADIFSGVYPRDYDSEIYSTGGFLLKRHLVSTGMLEDFWTFMAGALLFSCMFASPVLLYHIWAFIAAGLYAKERAVVYRALPFAVLLLMSGVAFGYFIMVPYGLYFLASLADWTQVAPMFTVALYFKFFLTLTVALGLVFQMPILMVALQKVGILKFATLVKHWRWVILGIFLISAMLTPPDPVTQMLMVTPMLALFSLGLGLMWQVDRKQKLEAPAETTAEPKA